MTVISSNLSMTDGGKLILTRFVFSLGFILKFAMLPLLTLWLIRSNGYYTQSKTNVKQLVILPHLHARPIPDRGAGLHI